MSHTAHCAPLWMAQRACDALKELLAPYCELVTVAGSVRRERETVNDLELVVIPASAKDPESLFGEETCALRLACGRVAAGQVTHLRRRRQCGGRAAAWGERFKQLQFFDHGRWFNVDLFIVSRETYGAELALRTGPAEFSKLLVTSSEQGGAMPSGWRLQGGQIHTPAGGGWNRF